MEILTLIAHNLFSFIVILSIIVFVHEYGHYWVAKKAGVKIDSFSIGFGKEIFGWNDKSGTRWKISLIPLGGYVKMYGDEGAASNPDNDKIKQMTDEQKAQSFFYKPLHWRFLIVLAGPAANFIFAIIILVGFFYLNGRPETLAVVAEINEQSSAERAGLQLGDLITEMDGKTVSRFEDLKSISSLHPDITVDLTYIRNGVTIETQITPERVVTQDVFGNEIEIGIIGIRSDEVKYERLGVLESSAAAVQETYRIASQTLEAVGQMIMGTRPSDQISGILRIADYSGKSVDKGLRWTIWFMVMLSINLGTCEFISNSYAGMAGICSCIQSRELEGRHFQKKCRSIYSDSAFIYL
jgi:regulator of sigma E protease